MKNNIVTKYESVKLSSIKNKNELSFCYDGDYDQILAAGGYLHQIFENTVKKYPERIAVQYNHERITYADLNNRANNLAHYLTSLGVGANDFAGICLPRTPDMYIAMLGILKAGAAYLPIDTKYPAERVKFILSDCRAKTIISTSAILDIIGRLTCLKIQLDKDQNKIDLHASLKNSEYQIKPSSGDTAYAIYTSGTTGAPKGVKISHRAVCNLVRAEGKIFGVKPDDKVFQGFSIAFDASVEEIWLAFYSGSTLFVGTESMMQCGPNLPKILNENKITVLSTVPTFLSMFNDEIPLLRILILGGEVCPNELAKRWATPDRRIINTYGPTETTVIATFSECSPDKNINIGKPIPNYSAYILDSDLQKVSICLVNCV